MNRIFLYLKDSFLCMAAILIVLLVLLRLAAYLLFLPAYPITRADKKEVIQYCEDKYGGKAVIKKSEALQYGVSCTRFDEYTVQMDSDLFHVNVSVEEYDMEQSGRKQASKLILGDDRQLEEVRSAMVRMLTKQMDLPEPDRVVFQVSPAFGDKHNTSIKPLFDGGNIKELYNEEGIDAALLYRDIDLSQYSGLKGVLPSREYGNYFGHLFICRVRDIETLDKHFPYDDTTLECLEFDTEYNGKNWGETVTYRSAAE